MEEGINCGGSSRSYVDGGNNNNNNPILAHWMYPKFRRVAAIDCCETGLCAATR